MDRWFWFSWAFPEPALAPPPGAKAVGWRGATMCVCVCVAHIPPGCSSALAEAVERRQQKRVFRLNLVVRIGHRHQPWVEVPCLGHMRCLLGHCVPAGGVSKQRGDQHANYLILWAWICSWVPHCRWLSPSENTRSKSCTPNTKQLCISLCLTSN